jgi:hypothetical protein
MLENLLAFSVMRKFHYDSAERPGYFFVKEAAYENLPLPPKFKGGGTDFCSQGFRLTH